MSAMILPHHKPEHSPKSPRSSWSRSVELAKIVAGCTALHLVAWTPVVYHCITEHPEHIRPMAQGLVIPFVIIIPSLGGVIVAFRQVFQKPRYLAIVSLALGAFPVGLTFGTFWLITDYLGVRFAP